MQNLEFEGALIIIAVVAGLVWLNLETSPWMLCKRGWCALFGHDYKTRDGLRCKRCGTGWPA